MNRKLAKAVILATVIAANSGFTNDAGELSPRATDNRIPVFYVLLKNDETSEESNREISLAAERQTSGFRISTLNRRSYLSVRRMLSDSHFKHQSISASSNSARSTLGRYLVLEFDSIVDIDEILNELRADPNIEYVTVDEVIDTSAACPNIPSSIQSFTSFSKTWGFDQVRASQAWSYETGHAFIGIVDLGLQMTHADLKDFNGNTFLFGNFHPHLSLDIGDRSYVLTNPSRANPYGGWGYFGEVDWT